MMFEQNVLYTSYHEMFRDKLLGEYLFSFQLPLIFSVRLKYLSLLI